MHFTPPVFRPAFEEHTPLLQVTDGCSYNNCSFCSMYKTVPFRVSPMEEIEEDLQELRETFVTMTRLFLVNADPFCLSADRLAAIASACGITSLNVRLSAALRTCRTFSTNRSTT